MKPPEPTFSPCCSKTYYLDPICVVGGKPVKVRIGAVVRCSGCHRIFGEARLDKFPSKEVAALQKKFNGTTMAMLVDKNIKSPGCPMTVEMKGGLMLPEGYAGELKEQPEMEIEDDGVPF